MPELFDMHFWLQLVSTLGGIFVVGYTGFLRLGAKVDSIKIANDLGHEQIIQRLDKQNGALKEQRDEMVKQKIVCAETHGKRGPRGIQGERGYTGARGEKGESG